MLTLDQLPFQAEGYRDLVCLITKYGRWHCGLTIGSRRRGDGWDCDIAIALSQACRAIHTWYCGTYDRAWLRAGSRDGVAGSAGSAGASSSVRHRGMHVSHHFVPERLRPHEASRAVPTTIQLTKNLRPRPHCDGNNVALVGCPR